MISWIKYFILSLIVINKLQGLGFDNNKPFVSCRLVGQLGNQLFQIATTLAYAWDHDADAFFPDLNITGIYQQAYNRDHIFFRLDTSTPPRPFANEYKEKIPYEIPFKPDQLLIGFFLRHKYFSHYRERLLQILEPSHLVINKLYDKYFNLINNPFTVAVHVRTFNPESHNAGHFYFIGLGYYKKAFIKFPPEVKFVIFSDRINWCKKHFSEIFKNEKMIFIEGNDHIEDLFLSSLMKHHIIPNSSYAWWAAYLNKNPDKCVIAPKNWRKNHGIRSELYFNDWILIEPDWNETYPSDMRNYDKISQSMDTQ